MTRLTHPDISSVASELESYDRALTARTGHDLLSLACLACEVSPDHISTVAHSCSVAVVPLTYGLGEITGFAQTVKAIVSHLGFAAFVSKAKDLAGLAESYASQAHIVMLADDERFLAIELAGRRIIDNARSTGRAYAAVLSQMAGGLDGREVLVIGCGRVGEAAAGALLDYEAKVSLYDLDHERAQRLADKISRAKGAGIAVMDELEAALASHEILFDASPAANVIQERHITPHTFVAAPGVPHGVKAEALPKLGERFVHDPLQLGVAAMVVEACDCLASETIVNLRSDKTTPA